MIVHHLKLFFRALQRNKGIFLINLIGLTTGIACTLLIALWVFDELSVDGFHSNGSRLYQVVEMSEREGREIQNPSTAGLLGEALAREFPEIENSTSVRESDELLVSYKEQHIKAKGLFGSPGFFEVFSFPILQGNERTILSDRRSVVVSEGFARRLFGDIHHAIGKSVLLNGDIPFNVTGIFQDVPGNSSLQFEFLLPFEFLKETRPNFLDWDYNTTNVYLVMEEGIDMARFNEKIEGFLGTKTESNGRLLTTRLFSENYLYGGARDWVEKSGRITYVRLFSTVALLILLIACINFMNLSTANASRRLREIGVKKALGSSRKTLVLQYLTEALLLTGISAILALLLVVLLLPNFNVLAAKEMHLGFEAEFLLIFGVILLVTGLLAGSYPAFYLSGLSAVTTIKGKLNTSRGELMSRRGLVVFQFALSTVLILSVVIVYQQLEYLHHKNLGYDKDNLVYFDIDGKIGQNLGGFLSEVERLEGIRSASSISTNIVGGNNTTTRLQWPGKLPDEQEVFQIRPVNYGMLETLGIELLQGRPFATDFGAEESKIIFNETAIEAMGLEDPLGKTVSLENTNFEIIGVSEDFHFASLHEKIKPLFFVFRPNWTDKVMAKIEAGNEQIALENLRRLYRRYNPDLDFDYRFLDQTYAAQYASEQRISTLAQYFAGLAVLISCLGLFGLATFNAKRRKKEISIRKVLGQSTAQITLMLSKAFAKPVLWSMVIAAPIAYLLLNDWLSTFAYRIPLRLWYFPAAGFLALSIAMFTVGSQAIRAANNNPVEGLREE